MTASVERAVTIGGIAGTDLLRFAELHSFDAADGSRIKSQYAAELTAGTNGTGAFGVRACGDLIAAASFGTVRLPRPGAISGRIDVVVTTARCRGRGLARGVVGRLLAHFLDTYGEQLEHVSVVAVHPTIERIVARFGFTDAGVGTTSPVLHRVLDPAGRVEFRVVAEQAEASAMRGLRTDCARCLWGKQAPWCGRQGPAR